MSATEHSAIVERLRALIVASAPEPESASAVMHCSPDAPLDAIMPFSSVIVLGTVVAIEAEFGVRVAAEAVHEAAISGTSLSSLARLILQARSCP